MSSAHAPITVTAHLSSAPIVIGPILLDGLLTYAVGRELGRRHVSGWASDEEVEAAGLPLARVEVGDAWWWAASQVTPTGPEATTYTHRRPPLLEMAILTDAKRTEQMADKPMRIPRYYRPGMMQMTWTAVGDAVEVARLLHLVPGVGGQRTHGHGMVARWEVVRGGPPLSAYASDLTLRHLPREAVRDVPGDVVTSWSRLPLHPPYHRRDRAVDVVQVVG